MGWASLAGTAKAFWVRPREAWEEIRDQETDAAELFTGVVFPAAAVPAIAHLLGFWYHGFFSTIFKAILWYALAVVAVWVVGKTLVLLAPQFDAVPDETKAFRLAAYSFLPYFSAGIFYLLPFLSIVTLFGGLYGMVVLYHGIPVLMNIPDEKSIPYALTGGTVMLIAVVLIGCLTGGLIWPGKP